MKKTKIKMNKPIYLGLSILEISKILMYEFWNDYMKPKYNDNVKLCYMDTDSFVMNIKANDFYKDISHDVECKFDTSNYEVKRPLPIGKNKKVIGLMKDELGGEFITKLIKNLNDPHAFLEYLNDMNDVLEDIINYNKNRDKKVLIIFDDMIADIMRSEKFKAIVKELFIRCSKLNISIVFITQPYFRTPLRMRD